MPVGGGGLAAGTAMAAKAINPDITVIGVEPRAGADTAASLRSGHLVTLPTVPGTIADGLRHTSPAPLPWEINKVLLDDVITVTDDDIVQAMRWTFEHLKIVAELSGAARSPRWQPGGSRRRRRRDLWRFGGLRHLPGTDSRAPGREGTRRCLTCPAATRCRGSPSTPRRP